MDIKEIFVDIPNYNGIYQISNLGNIISLDRKIKVNNYTKLIKGKLIKPSISSGYYSVGLHKDGKTKTFFIHQLVAISFLNHKPNKHKIVVDHIDGNKLNNSINNLQLISQRENFHKGNRIKNIKGIWFELSRNKWRASISISGKQVIIGRYVTKELAEIAYKEKLKTILNEH